MAFFTFREVLNKRCDIAVLAGVKVEMPDAIGLLRDKNTEHEERDRPMLFVRCNEGISGCHTMESGHLTIFSDWLLS